MLIPYSTDAAIDHFPRTTLGMIVATSIVFAITGMGEHARGLFLSYGQGLHPQQWITYNFVHVDFLQLIGNMYFLWTFGIVVEGKLGWWKFLILYLGMGICGGVLIQLAMLGHVQNQTVDINDPLPERHRIWSENSLFAQENTPIGDALPTQSNTNKGGKPANPKKAVAPRGNAQKIAEGNNISFRKVEPGFWGASLIIYGLMAIVLIWAPQNEVHCLWLFFFRAGTIELEYFHLCGSYIAIETIIAAFGSRGIEMTAAAGHVVGVAIGVAVGALLVKKRWVDCENWDLFSIIGGQHCPAPLPVNGVGEWQSPNLAKKADPSDDSFVIRRVRAQNADAEKKEDDEANKPKKKPKPKLVELESFVEEFEQFSDDDFELELSSEVDLGSFSLTPCPSGAESFPSALIDPTARINQMLFNNEFQAALYELRCYWSCDPSYVLPKNELRMLLIGLFKERAVKDVVPLIREFITRFDDDADRERVKLAVLYVKFMQRPTAALKLLARIKVNELPKDYHSIYRTTAAAAQQLIADGVIDAAD